MKLWFVFDVYILKIYDFFSAPPNIQTKI